MIKPTIKLYETDAYIKTFSATVLSCEEKDGAFFVVLDKTAFFPEGGGQDADKGIIDGIEVLDVQIKDDVVYHKLPKAFEIGATVECHIDWETRFSRMQNHTGEHIVSGVIHNNFGYNNVGFHMGEKVITLDVDGPLSEKDITFIELEVNKVIYNNKQIIIHYPTSDELNKLDYRSKLDLTENVRIVEIEDTDLCACCAPHVARTGEIGIVKIIGFIPYKKGTRIEMVAGHLALADYQAIHNSNKAIMNMLSAKREETFDSVQRIHKELSDIKAQNKNMASKLALLQMEKHLVGSSVCAFTENASYDELRYCSNALIKEDFEFCYIFSETEDNNFIYIVASEKNSIQNAVKELNNAFNGRGGGRDFYAQGKIVATKEDIIKKLGSN